jgi:hypothetical protein
MVDGMSMAETKSSYTSTTADGRACGLGTIEEGRIQTRNRLKIGEDGFASAAAAARRCGRRARARLPAPFGGSSSGLEPMRGREIDR